MEYRANDSDVYRQTETGGIQRYSRKKHRWIGTSMPKIEFFGLLEPDMSILDECSQGRKILSDIDMKSWSFSMGISAVIVITGMLCLAILIR